MRELRIEKKDFGFRMIIDNESYFIKDSGDGWFRLITETENGEITDVSDDKYENLGVTNLKELLCKLIITPQDTLEMLLGVKMGKIEKIVIGEEND
ncbi:MAG: hypothetical protein RXR43_15535 [Sulfolobus sp.]